MYIHAYMYMYMIIGASMSESPPCEVRGIFVYILSLPHMVQTYDQPQALHKGHSMMHACMFNTLAYCAQSQAIALFEYIVPQGEDTPTKQETRICLSV